MFVLFFLHFYSLPTNQATAQLVALRNMLFHSPVCDTTKESILFLSLSVRMRRSCPSNSAPIMEYALGLAIEWTNERWTSMTNGRRLTDGINSFVPTSKFKQKNRSQLFYLVRVQVIVTNKIKKKREKTHVRKMEQQNGTNHIQFVRRAILSGSLIFSHFFFVSFITTFGSCFCVPLFFSVCFKVVGRQHECMSINGVSFETKYVLYNHKFVVH